MVAVALLVAPATASATASAPHPAVVHVPAERLALGASASPASPGTVRRATEEVLSRPAYGDAQPGRVQRWLERVRAWLGARLLGFLDAASGRTIAWGVVGAATLTALYVAWRLLRGTRRDPARREAVTDDVRRSAVHWDAASRAAERRGDLREAVRAAYRAVVAGLAAGGQVDEVPGRTVGEYRRAVARAAPERAPAFSAASDVVEQVLYAGRVPTPSDLATVRDAASRPVGRSA